MSAPPETPERPEAPLSGQEYAAQLAAARAEMPEALPARWRWRSEQLRAARFDERVIRHAFLGRDISAGIGADAPQPTPDPEYLRDIEPGWMWVRIDNNSRANYVTAGHALNLADPAAGGWAADWHPMCWSVPLEGVRPGARDCLSAERSPLRGNTHYHETRKALGGRGVIDVRPGLKSLGHPAGARPDPVFGASHARAVIDKAWNALRRGARPVARQVTPGEVARWLWEDEQFEALGRMARDLEGAAWISAEELAAWREWRESLSPEATWKDTPELERKAPAPGPCRAPAP